MVRVLAFDLDPPTLARLRAQAGQWSVDLAHERAPSDPAELRAVASGVDVLVVGNVPDPLRTAERASMTAPHLAVVLVAARPECEALAEKVRFSAFLGQNVRCLATDAGDHVVDEIGDAVERARRRNTHARTLESLNQKLYLAPERPAPAAAILGRLLEIAPLGVAVTDEDGLIRAVNPLAEDLLQASGESLLGEPFEKPFAEEDRGRLQELLRRMTDAAQAEPRSTFTLDERIVELTGTRLSEAANEQGWLVLMQDVTERMSLIGELEEAHRRKDAFLAILGHELRNPLAPIRTALEIMRRRDEEMNRREREVIERQVDHLVQLVDDLLDVARLTRGKVALRTEPVEASVVVRRALEMASPLLEARRHHVLLDVPSRGLTVEGDVGRLAQVVANLLTNAAKFTPKSGRVEVSGRAEGEEAVITVRDTGPGIDPELLPRIFEPFEQKTQSVERSSGGLGLGLAIVRSLVELHGGVVRAENAAAGGAELVVRLPLLKDARGAAVSATESDALPAGAPEKTRILVVDDNVDAALLLAEILQLSGYEPLIAHDGPSALALARQQPPDLAILDIGLPVMDGYELARELRALPGLESLPLVAVTGYGAESDRRKTQNAGFDEHLVKPIDLSTLSAAIARRLAARS